MIFLCFIFVIFLNFNLISASFTIGNLSHSVLQQYSPLDSVQGWINISLNNEPSTSLFKTNFGDSISLLNLLGQNPGFSYSCFPNCILGYSLIPSSGETSKDFILNAGQQQIYGINLTGNPFSSVTGFSLNVTSNAPESNVSQLYIDVLNDGSIEWQAYNASGNFGAEGYGCYDSNAQQNANQFVISLGDKYCEQIVLPPTTGVDLIAGIQAVTGGASTFKLSIDDQNGRSSSCIASAVAGVSSQKISCNISNFPILQQQIFSVCIENKTFPGSYEIYYESNQPVCGFTKTGQNYDFNISAKTETYSSLNNFILNDSETTKSTGVTSIEQEITQYVNSNYNMDCSNGCIIPVNFISNSNQELLLSNLKVDYNSGGGTKPSVNVLYNLTTSNFTINSGFGKLFLDNAGFSVPNSTGANTLSLTLNNSLVFSDSINITLIPKITSISPNITVAGYPTNFTITTNNAGGNITEYEWYFGDGTRDVSFGKNIMHTYGSISNFNINVTIIGKNSQRISTAFFTIQVESPKDAVNQLLTQKINGLNNTKQQIQGFPQFYQNPLNSVLNITSLQTQLSSFVSRNNSATSDDNYISIMEDLINLRVPDSITSTNIVKSAPFYTDNSEINLDVLKSIGNINSVINQNDYVNAIASWNLENIVTTANFDELSVNYGGSNEQVLSVIQINASKKTNLDYNPYLLIKKMNNLNFDKNYNQKQNGNYYYIELTNTNMAVNFATTENVNFTDIPAFISPDLSKLSVVGPVQEETPVNTTPILILAFSILVVAAVIVFLLLKRWYRIRYENYLFRNKNDLYNIVSYIQSSKKAGTSESDISEKLRKAGWKAEQVRYVMRKYAGKKTGL